MQQQKVLFFIFSTYTSEGHMQLENIYRKQTCRRAEIGLSAYVAKRFHFASAIFIVFFFIVSVIVS